MTGPLRGIATYAGSQSAVSLRTAQDEARALGVDYRLLHVTQKFSRRLWRYWRSPIEDSRVLFSLATRNLDFLVVNPGGSLMRRAGLLRKALEIADRREIRTFVYWHSCGWILRNKRENQLGPELFDDLARALRRPWIHHLTLSPSAAQDLASALGVNRSFLIGNGQAVPGRFSEPLLPDDDPPIVLNVATVQPRKGPDLFIDVAERVCQEHPSARFVWVGGYATAELAAEIEKRGLADRVEFVGPAYPPYDWMQRASVLFVPSRSEAFALTAAEAMACHRTVCCFAGTGPEYVAGDTGIVVPQFDTSLAATRILELLSKPPEERVNHPARERYKAMFSPEPYARRLAAVIKEPDSAGAEYLLDASQD